MTNGIHSAEASLQGEPKNERIHMLLGNFNFIETEIEGLFIVETKRYSDSRGFFMETYKYSDFACAGLTYRFIQDNQSKSKKGVLRGLHYQIHHPQAKLVRVLEGAVYDVAVDLRRGSKTYGKYVGVELSAENGLQFMIPRGFAHGFLVLSEEAVFCYKCDAEYRPNDEGGIIYNDPSINILWPKIDAEILLSEKDKKHPKLKELEKIG